MLNVFTPLTSPILVTLINCTSILGWLLPRKGSAWRFESHPVPTCAPCPPVRPCLVEDHVQKSSHSSSNLIGFKLWLQNNNNSQIFSESESTRKPGWGAFIGNFAPEEIQIPKHGQCKRYTVRDMSVALGFCAQGLEHRTHRHLRSIPKHC